VTSDELLIIDNTILINPNISFRREALCTLPYLRRTMEDTPGLSEQYRKASPWPLFVALGIPLSELGILFGLFPVAVGGLLLFGGSAAGMAAESGYAQTAWRGMAGVAVVLLVLGLAFVFTALDLPDRGAAILVAAIILVAAGATGEFFARDVDPTY
jgi:hypothetical protein